MRYAAAHMPPKAPLQMQPQTFSDKGERRVRHKARRMHDMAWRLAAFIPTIALTTVLCISLARYLALGGVAPMEGVVLGLVGLTFVWLAFSVNTACMGVLRVAIVRSPDVAPSAPHTPRDIALLMPVYNEAAWDVFGNASAMLKELRADASGDRYTLFILSDTRKPELAAQEERRSPRCKPPFIRAPSLIIAAVQTTQIRKSATSPIGSKTGARPMKPWSCSTQTV